MAETTEIRTREYVAKHRFARIAPRKARLVIDMIRGRDVEQAMNMLAFSRKRAAVFVGKVLKSALANATEQEARAESLYVKECWVDPGPIIKRFQPKDRGKAYQIQKKMCHIVVKLQEKPEKARPRSAAAGKQAG